MTPTLREISKLDPFMRDVASTAQKFCFSQFKEHDYTPWINDVVPGTTLQKEVIILSADTILKLMQDVV
jgi:hypothetical protein